MSIEFTDVNDNSWLDSDGKLTKGKYKGKSLRTVSIMDHAYLSWVLDNVDLSDEDRKVIKVAMTYKGK